MHILMHWDRPWLRLECGAETIIYTQDGREVLRFTQGASEDRTFQRGFRDCRHVDELLRAAYVAGQRGEPLTIETHCTPTAQELTALGLA